MTETFEEIFKTSDIKPTDPLQKKKVSTLRILKAGFKKSLTKNPPTHYQPSHVYWMIENYKAFIIKFFADHPEYHDLEKIPDGRIKFFKGWGDLYDTSGKALRKRYQLFAVDKLDGKNWREKIRDAKSADEIEWIERAIVLKSRQFFEGLGDDASIYSYLRNRRKKLLQTLAEANQDEERSDSLVEDVENLLFYQRGKGVANFIKCELLKKETEEVLAKTKEKYQRLGFQREWKKPSSELPELNEVGKIFPKDDFPSDTDSEEGKLSRQDLEKKLDEVKKELEAIKNSTQPQNKEKIEEKIAELQENAEGNDDLQKEIKALRQQLEEVKQSLKSILAEAKDYIVLLFNWFKKENVKQINFEEDSSAKVEYEDKQPKTISASEIEKNQELLTLREYSRQSQQKSLSRQELSQIVGSSTSPTSTEKSHWDNYGKYYIGAGIVLVLFSAGAFIYHLWTRSKEK